MKLLITGGTGFIGRALCQALDDAGHTLVILSRSAHPAVGARGAPRASSGGGIPSDPERAKRVEGESRGRRFVTWQPPASGPWEREFDGADGVINLAGESVVAKRWTPAQKQRMADSRVATTRALITAISRAARRPAVLISASAIGYYGPHGEEPLDEDAPPGSDFLAQVCQQWEDAARDAEPLGVRVVRLRIGLVLARDGGALAKMLPPFQWGLGGPLGSGRQWMSWVHRDDVIGLIRWALEDVRVSGAVDATAPNPVTMRVFASTLGRTLHRPAVAAVPALALRLLLGEMAEMLVAGQRVLPAKAQRMGYPFRYATIEAALSACLAPSATAG